MGDGDREGRREELFGRLRVGDMVTGTVSGLASYGAFVDIGGAEGLIHVSELSWDRVRRVAEMVQPGQLVDVKVIRLNRDQKQIMLSLRQAERN